jgi:hypothetical protein
MNYQLEIIAHPNGKKSAEVVKYSNKTMYEMARREVVARFSSSEELQQFAKISKIDIRWVFPIKSEYTPK